MTSGRFLASARSRFFIEPFQFERVDAFALNAGRMKLRRRGVAMVWNRGTPGRGVDQDGRREKGQEGLFERQRNARPEGARVKTEKRNEKYDKISTTI